MRKGLIPLNYVGGRFPPQDCERFARRIYWHLREGRIEEAEMTLLWAKLSLHEMYPTPGDYPIAELGIRGSTVAALRDVFDAKFVRDLERISPDDIRVRTHVSNESIATLVDRCMTIGFPWPANGE